MQVIGRQLQRTPDGAPVHYERHRPEQTTLYRLVHQHAANFFAQTEAAGTERSALGRPRHPPLPVRQRALSLPIPLCLLLASQPKLVMPVLPVVHRIITRRLLGRAGRTADQAYSGAVTLTQRLIMLANEPRSLP